MKNYFQGRSDHPYHLSVGAVLLNDKNEVACHYFVDAPVIGGEVCILMRESVEDGEVLEEALARGLMEEFGAMGNISTYIGSKETFYKS
ncbi:MAG TPA: NUDIX hydrolase, partial [Candidatus Saccharimonadales bacterium]|nr:NUDIX hydrolase [Candidatus Saccharimonadales bacterium]